jgi:hypothetical protein
MSNHNNTTPAININNLSLLKAALAYSAHARVFPLTPNTKLPLLQGNWASYATKDPMQVIEWWTQHPTANIALVMDTAFTCIDIDTKDGKDGAASFNDLHTTKSPVHQTTTSGGVHLIYRHPPTRQHPFHNATNKGTHQGIDVRSGNAYIVVAPSVVDGKPYTLRGDLSDAPTLPDDLTELLTSWQSQSIVQIGVEQPTLLANDLLAELIDPTRPPLVTFRNKRPYAFYLSGDASAYDNDNSAALMGLVTLCYASGMSDAEVLTLLSANNYCMNVAFKRKGGDREAQISWLWRYTCQKARTNAPLDATTTFEEQQTDAMTILDTITDNSMSNIEKVKEFLEHVAAQTDRLKRDAMLQQLKGKRSGMTFEAIKGELRAIEQRRQRELEQQQDRHPLIFNDLMPDSDRPQATTVNFNRLLAYYGITIRYNEMTHEWDIGIPNSTWHCDNEINDKITAIRDLMTKHNMAIERVREFCSAVASINSYHPVRDMLRNTTWDKQPRVDKVIDTLTTQNPAISRKLIKTWLCSAVKVTGYYGTVPPRGVLVLAGPQNCGKTTFFRTITPQSCFKEGLSLHTDNKDSIKQAVSSWIIELGELDATFRKSDIAALKAFLSNTTDAIRLPYAASESTWARRSVYAGTVNDTSFLRDQTGNTRFWTIDVERIDLTTLHALLKGDNLAQFWKEVEHLLDTGHNYVLSATEMIELEKHNEQFREIPYEEELLEQHFDWHCAERHPMTMSEIKQACGVAESSRAYSNMTTALKRKLGKKLAPEVTRRGGKMGRFWMMPPRTLTFFQEQQPEQDDPNPLSFLD